MTAWPLTFLPSFITEPDSVALCSETDPDIFFPEKGGSNRAAKETCHRCELIDPCLAWALTHDELGVWGGRSEHERHAIKRGNPVPRHRANTWTDAKTQAAILRAIGAGMRAIDVARDFNVSERTVYRIVRAAELDAAS